MAPDPITISAAAVVANQSQANAYRCVLQVLTQLAIIAGYMPAPQSRGRHFLKNTQQRSVGCFANKKMLIFQWFSGKKLVCFYEAKNVMFSE